MMDDSFSFESVKLNAGSDPTKAATLKEEDDDGVLGKRHRNSNGDASHDVKAPTQHPQPSKKPKVEDPVAKAERRRILEEKKRLLADVEKELAKISQKSPSLLSASTSSLPTPKYSASAPTTPMLSSSGPAAPLPAGRGGGVGRGRGRGGGRGGGSKSTPLRSSTTTTAEVIEPEGEPATPVGHVSASSTPLSSASELVATGSRAKRKSPSAAAGIPRRASHDVSTLPTSPTPEGPVTRAKRARRPKRLDNFGGPANLSWALRQCQVLLKTLMTHKFGWPFNQPVDPIALNIPDYFDVIKHPMDLGTIKEQLDSGNYETEEEFADDVRLVFTNTFTYNQPGSDIVVMASTLSSLFSEKFEILKAKIEERGRDAPSEDWVSELRDTASSVQREFERIKRTPNGRGRVGAAEDQRPMTFEEKKKLSHAINNLPSENLGMVVKIIHERMPQLTASGEEIEIDIDALNPATLRHLERYVRSVTQRAGRRRGSRTPSLTGSSKNVQNAEPLAPPPQGTQQKIEDVERQIKALTEHQQALTQKGLARSGETDLLLAAAEEKKKKRNNDDSDSSESETDGSDSSESSDSETSDSESDSGSDSESTDSEAEKQDAAAAASAAAAAATVPQQAMTKVAGDASGAAAAAASSDDTTTGTGEASSSSETAGDVSTTASVAGEVTAASAPLPAIEPATASAEADDGTRQENGQNNKVGSAISFSFDPSLGTKESSILPAEVGNGDESLPQAAVAVDDAPPKTEAPKQVALKNVDAWSELSDDFEAPTGKPQSPPSLDKTWSQFQTKKMQDAIRVQLLEGITNTQTIVRHQRLTPCCAQQEKERLEKEERERKERERREEERRLEEERRRREHEEAEERRRREAEEAELNAQRERERQRQAERLARERGELSMMEQSLLMASFEQQAPPALPLFQYKSLDDVEADFDLDAQPTMDGEGLGKGVDVGRGRSYEGGSDDRDGEATEPEEGAEMELSPTAPLPVPASDEMEEGQI